MLFSGKENVFMCLVAFQKMFRKIFSDVWLCSWKYHKKHIFYLLLTFSHIFSVTKRIYNIIYSSKHKQNPEKNHKIRTNEGEIAIVIGVVGASYDRDRDRRIRTMRRSRSRSRSREDRRIAWRSKCWSRSTLPRQALMSADGDVAIDSFFLPLSLSLSLFYFPRPEVIWSENRNGNSFLAFRLWNSVNWKCFSVWPNLK